MLPVIFIFVQIDEANNTHTNPEYEKVSQNPWNDEPPVILRITFEAGLWDQKAKEKRKWVRWKGKALSVGSLEVRSLDERRVYE